MERRQADKWTFKRHGKYIGKAIDASNTLFLSSMAEGFTLNLCCGYDSTGDVLVDLDEPLLRQRQETISERMKVIADTFTLPFRYASVDTIICDPDFRHYAKWHWIFELFKIARRRVILSVPTVDIRPPPGWTRDLYYIGSNHIMIRLWYVFDKVQLEQAA